jgi:hypothetical protein
LPASATPPLDVVVCSSATPCRPSTACA